MGNSLLAKKLLALAEELQGEEVVVEEPIEETESVEEEIVTDEEDISKEIEDLEKRLAAVTPVGDDVLETEKEIENWAEELTTECTGGEITEKADEIEQEDMQEIEDSTGIVLSDFESEDQNVKTSTEEEVEESFEDQDEASDEDKDIGVEIASMIKKAVEELVTTNNVDVEELLGVESDAQEGLDVVKEDTELNDTDINYASSLKEASIRLDRVAEALERKANGNVNSKWIKLAHRIDFIADRIDNERKAVAVRVGKRIARKSGILVGKSVVASILS